MAPEHLVATRSRGAGPASQRPTISSVRPTVSKRAAQRVHVGGVEEGDAAGGGAVEDGDGRGLVALQTEGHRAEAEPGDRKPGAAETDMAHGFREYGGWGPTASGPRNVVSWRSMITFARDRARRRAWLMVAVALLCLGAPANRSRAADPDPALIGRWESVARSTGGLGQVLSFDPTGP